MTKKTKKIISFLVCIFLSSFFIILVSQAEQKTILNFDDIYDTTNNTFKNFETIVSEGFAAATDTNFDLQYNYTEPIIFKGIDGLPEGAKLNVNLFNDANDGKQIYFAVDKGVTVNNITVPDNEQGVAGIVVAGTAESITIGNNITCTPNLFINTNAQDELEWISSPSNSPEDQATGVVIGAYDGGKINGDILVGDYFNISATSHGFLGMIIGAYKNSTAENIIIGDYATINAEYVQAVIGANENSVVKDITTGSQLYINTTNSKFVTIGAGAGLPVEQSNNFKASKVSKIKMRQASNIFCQGASNITEDGLSNVVIGAERGSSAEQILIEEHFSSLAPDAPELNDRWNWFNISNSAKVSIGAYNNATIGNENIENAISLKEITLYDNSYSPGNLCIGATKGSIIKGNVSAEVFGLMTYFYNINEYENTKYDVAIGATEKGKIEGTVKVKAFAYSTWLDTPPTIIGAFGEGAYIKEVLIDVFASIHLYNYDPSEDTIIGSDEGTIDTLRINGDLFVKMSKTNTSNDVYDFIANKIIIESGNIIGEDRNIKDGGVPGVASHWEFYQNPDNIYKVPPWIHSDFRMSVNPVNQFGEPLKKYMLMDIKSQEAFVNTAIIEVNSNKNSYNYLYGNDFRAYIETWGSDEYIQQGYIRPSWTTDIYDLNFGGLNERKPFVHFVYLPKSEVTPLDFTPSQNESSDYKISDKKTSVHLEFPLDIDYINQNQNGLAPEIYIYDNNNELVYKFELNSLNSSKFYFSHDGVSSNKDNKGNYLVINLANISELSSNVLYRVEIKNLNTQLANALLVPEFSISENNSDTISWKFMMEQFEVTQTQAPKTTINYSVDYSGGSIKNNNTTVLSSVFETINNTPVPTVAESNLPKETQVTQEYVSEKPKLELELEEQELELEQELEQEPEKQLTDVKNNIKTNPKTSDDIIKNQYAIVFCLLMIFVFISLYRYIKKERL